MPVSWICMPWCVVLFWLWCVVCGEACKFFVNIFTHVSFDGSILFSDSLTFFARFCFNFFFSSFYALRTFPGIKLFLSENFYALRTFLMIKLFIYHFKLFARFHWSTFLSIIWHAARFHGSIFLVQLFLRAWNVFTKYFF